MYLIHCGILSLLLFIFYFPCLVFLPLTLFANSLPSTSSSNSHYLTPMLCSQHLFYFKNNPLYFNFPRLSTTSSNLCPCYVPFSLSFTFKLRLSQFQMSWLQSCWVTRQTLAPLSLWSLGGANFTDPSACVYPCPRPGGKALETPGRVTPPVCVCFALS